MDLFEWVKKHKLKSFFVSLVVLILIPFIIDKLSNVPAITPFLSVTYDSTDILAFYGIVLGSAATILALIETIQYTEKLHSLDYERQITPLLNSDIYNHSDSSLPPHRTLYVNVRPIAYFDRVSVMPSVDSRDLDDMFFGAQIDYSVQNISTASAVDINVYLNNQLLYGPFSLIAGSETSIGIYFFDEKGHLIEEYPRHQSFHISIKYTNAIHSKNFIQEEDISIEHIFMSLRDDPAFMPDYDRRTGLSTQRVV